MHFKRLLPFLGLAATTVTTATAQIISLPLLDLSLLDDVRPVIHVLQTS